MINDIIGKDILSYEVFEPWCPGPDAQVDGTPVFGALAIHTPDAVLTLWSRLRFSDRISRSPGLLVSVMDDKTWSQQSWLWWERSRLCSPRSTIWYRQTKADPPPLLPLDLGWKISEIQLRPEGRDAVALLFEGAALPVVFEYLPDFDGGIGLVSAETPTLKQIDHFSPQGEFAWLHPGNPIPVLYESYTLRSALFEDWPLPLRRKLVAKQELPCGKPLRRSAQLLLEPSLKDAYLDIVQMLISLRFKQHPWLDQRLVEFCAKFSNDDAYSALPQRIILEVPQKLPISCQGTSY